MSKKEKNELFGVLEGLGILLGLYLWSKSTHQIVGLFAVLLVPTIIVGIIIKLIPDKVQKKKAHKNKTTSKKNITKGKPSTSKSQTSTSIPNNRLLSDSEILKLELKDISAAELEKLCYLYYKSKGYRPDLTKKGADGGIDLTYYHPENGKTAVQIKHYIRSQRKINVDEIRKLDSAKKNYGCIFSEFITTSSYTQDALKESRIGMETHDITWFENKVIPWMKRESLKLKKLS